MTRLLLRSLSIATALATFPRGITLGAHDRERPSIPQFQVDRSLDFESPIRLDAALPGLIVHTVKLWTEEGPYGHSSFGIPSDPRDSDLRFTATFDVEPTGAKECTLWADVDILDGTRTVRVEMKGSRSYSRKKTKQLHIAGRVPWEEHWRMRMVRILLASACDAEAEKQ